MLPSFPEYEETNEPFPGDLFDNCCCLEHLDKIFTCLGKVNE